MPARPVREENPQAEDRTALEDEAAPVDPPVEAKSWTVRLAVEAESWAVRPAVEAVQVHATAVSPMVPPIAVAWGQSRMVRVQVE
jgi:hypothetical protein